MGPQKDGEDCVPPADTYYNDAPAPISMTRPECPYPRSVSCRGFKKNYHGLMNHTSQLKELGGLVGDVTDATTSRSTISTRFCTVSTSRLQTNFSASLSRCELVQHLSCTSLQYTRLRNLADGGGQHFGLPAKLCRPDKPTSKGFEGAQCAQPRLQTTLQRNLSTRADSLRIMSAAVRHCTSRQQHARLSHAVSRHYRKPS